MCTYPLDDLADDLLDLVADKKMEAGLLLVRYDQAARGVVGQQDPVYILVEVLAQYGVRGPVMCNTVEVEEESVCES